MSFFSRKKPPEIVVAASASGVELSTPSGTEVVSWDSITRIVAFKRDLFSRDLLCLVFETDRQTVVELNEGMEGWERLTRSLGAHLPEAVPFETWFAAVVSPAFELSKMEIYRRGESRL